MKPFRWSAEKNDTLERDRSISFERIVTAIEEEGGLLEVRKHPNREKYPHQRILVVLCEAYVFLVPFVEEVDYLFLKSIIPSRKATRDHLNARRRDEP